jgi:tellurite resistance protein
VTCGGGRCVRPGDRGPWHVSPEARGARRIGLAYLSVGGGALDLLAHALIGYGLLQMLVLARLSPWIARAGAVPGLWAFSFGANALATAPTCLVAQGDAGALAVLAPALFQAANGLVLGLAAMTLALLVRGRMFVAPVTASRART